MRINKDIPFFVGANYFYFNNVNFRTFGYTDKSFKFDLGKVNYGGGFRYLIAKQYRMHVGIDVAAAPKSGSGILLWAATGCGNYLIFEFNSNKETLCYSFYWLVQVIGYSS